MKPNLGQMRENTRFGFFFFFLAKCETTVSVNFFQDSNDIRRAVTDQTWGTWTLSESFKQ